MSNDEVPRIRAHSSFVIRHSPPMNPLHEYALQQTRRQFFRSSGLSMGALALQQLLGSSGQAAAAPAYGSGVHPALPGLPHIPPTAKRIIYLHMNGAPSQL